jgi:hypothetical protein
LRHHYGYSLMLRTKVTPRVISSASAFNTELGLRRFMQELLDVPPIYPNASFVGRFQVAHYLGDPDGRIVKQPRSSSITDASGALLARHAVYERPESVLLAKLLLYAKGLYDGPMNGVNDDALWSAIERASGYQGRVLNTALFEGLGKGLYQVSEAAYGARELKGSMPLSGWPALKRANVRPFVVVNAGRTDDGYLHYELTGVDNDELAHPTAQLREAEAKGAAPLVLQIAEAADKSLVLCEMWPTSEGRRARYEIRRTILSAEPFFREEGNVSKQCAFEGPAKAWQRFTDGTTVEFEGTTAGETRTGAHRYSNGVVFNGTSVRLAPTQGAYVYPDGQRRNVGR